MAGAGRGCSGVVSAPVACSASSRSTAACSASSRSTAVIWCGSTSPSASSGPPMTTTSTPEWTTAAGSGSVSGSVCGSSCVSCSISSCSSSGSSGSIRVSTSTGVRPLARASRSATRSPVRPSYSSRVVAARGTVNVSGETGGSAVSSSSRGCTTILPSRKKEAGDCTSTWAMSCHLSPVQVSPRRTRTPWPSASSRGARLSRTTSSCTIATAARTRHHSQSTAEPVCSARANHATVIAAAATAIPVARRARCTTATPGRPCDEAPWRGASASVSLIASVSSSWVWRASITAPAGSRSRRPGRLA